MPTIEQTGENGDHAVHMTLNNLLCTRACQFVRMRATFRGRSGKLTRCAR